MAGGVNKAILIGHLGRDPEIRYTPGGMAIANFSLATTENVPNKEGGREERTEWHRIVAFGRLAEICGEYLVKGKQVYIEGRIQTREWEDRDGNKRNTTEIVAQNMQMLGPASGGQGKGREPKPDSARGPGAGTRSGEDEWVDSGDSWGARSKTGRDNQLTGQSKGSRDTSWSGGGRGTEPGGPAGDDEIPF